MTGGVRQLALDLGLAPSHTLANFVAGHNHAAWNHLLQCSAVVGRGAMPTYLWGPSGSGKTHLLAAVHGALLDAGEAVAWADAQSEPRPFDERWSVLVLDDCHRYSERQQAMAFHWFVQALAPLDGVVRWVLAAGDRPPTDLPLREDLRSRLGWGHVFQLQPLSEAERRGVLRQAADERGLALADDVLDYLLRRFPRDLASLMALVERLDSYALQTQRAPTIPLVKAMLESE